MKKYWQILCAALMCLCGYACSNIDGLNDYNAVFSFEITDHKGTGGPIEIGEAEMDGNYIVIPVLHGIHNFPLYIKGEPKFENPIDCVVGIDFNDWVEIDLKRATNRCWTSRATTCSRSRPSMCRRSVACPANIR